MQSPLPVRDGVNATRLRLPDEGPWDTAMDYMMHRWGHIDPQGIEDRFDAGEIVGEAGIPLDRRHPAAEPHLHLVLPHPAAGDPDPGGTEHPAPGRAPPRGGQAALPAHHPRRHLHPGVGPGPAPEPAGPAGPDPHAPAGPHDRRDPAALHESRNPGQVPGALRKAPGPEGIRVRVRRRARARAPRRRLPRGGPEPDDQVPQLPARRGDRRRTQRRDPDRAAADL